MQITDMQLGGNNLADSVDSDGVILATTQPNYAPNTTTPPTAAAIVDEWETQSQADPTGFHVNIQEVLGTPLAESSAGRIAGNMNVFWDNADALTTNTVDDVGGAASGNVTQIMGTSLTETGSGDLAGAFVKFFDVTTPAKDINDVGGGTALSGGNTITITIQDDSDSSAIENAQVRMSSNGNGDETQSTDSSGQVTFTVIDATWTIRITASGYVGESKTLVVAGADQTPTYQLTAESGGGTPGFIG